MPSARFIAAITAPNTSECPAHLVTINRADWPAAIRLTDCGADVVSNSETFLARAIEVTLPGESAELGARRGRLVIDNTDPDIIARLRIPGPKPSARLDVVLAGFPNDLEESWPGLKVNGVAVNGGTIEIELTPRDDASESFPVQWFSPHRTPALY